MSHPCFTLLSCSVSADYGLADYFFDAIRVTWVVAVLCILLADMDMSFAFLIGEGEGGGEGSQSGGGGGPSGEDTGLMGERGSLLPCHYSTPPPGGMVGVSYALLSRLMHWCAAARRYSGCGGSGSGSGAAAGAWRDSSGGTVPEGGAGRWATTGSASHC